MPAKIKINQSLYDDIKHDLTSNSAAKVSKKYGLSEHTIIPIKRSFDFREYVAHRFDRQYWCQNYKDLLKEYGCCAKIDTEEFNAEWYFDPRYRTSDGGFIIQNKGEQCQQKITN